MFQIDFLFSNIESIHVLTSTFLAIYSVTSYPFVSPSRRKFPLIEIIKFLFTKLRIQNKKVSFIRVDEDGELVRSYEFMKTCHKLKIIFQATGVDTSSLNGKSKIPNKTLASITSALILNSRHNKKCPSPINMTSVSPIKPRIVCVAMFLNS